MNNQINESPNNYDLDRLSHALDLTVKMSREIDNTENLDEITYVDEYPLSDINKFMELMNRVDQVKRAVTKLQSDMKQVLADEFKDKAVRVGDKIVVGKPQKTWKPYDKQKVMDYVGDDWQLVVNPTFRTTGIKALAKERGQDPSVIFESLFYAEETGNVTILPESRAPKYLQKLEDLEVKELGKPKEGADND